MKVRSIAVLVLASSALAACAEAPLPPPQATLANIQTLRAGEFAPMKVGLFTAAPGKPTEMDKQVVVRAGAQSAPDGSFAKYLGDTLQAELKGAGKLDPNATLVVSGVVTQTHVDSAMPTASAELGARFTLVRDGKTVFEKTLDEKSTWDSSFIGAVAIPDAFNHYSGLFPKLVTTLLADADFRTAARP